MSARAYRNAPAFRRALEDRLRRRAGDTGAPLDRLRKEVAHQRLLARIGHVAPEGSWALKGGQVLLARLGEGARVTKDADATWRQSVAAFTAVLDEAVDLDFGDYFAFEAGEPRPLEAETDEGGLRYPIRSLVDGREFERLQLDVNVVPGDRRPYERLQLRDLLGFAGIEPPVIPVVPLAQHLAEKLHAYTRQYPEPSSRPRDLFDMLVIARQLPLPTAGDLVASCHETFALRRSGWPAVLPPPPEAWEETWSTYVADYAVPWEDLRQAHVALTGFWQPIVAATVDPSWSWDAIGWRWHVASP